MASVQPAIAATDVPHSMSYVYPNDSIISSSPQETLSSINAQLMTHGWAKRPLKLDRLGERDHAEVVTVLYELLGNCVSNLNNFDELAARHRTLTYENERLAKQNSQVRATNKRLEAETAGWKARCTDLEKKQAADEVKMKELREEVSRGRKALEGIRVASAHEAKKTQIHLDKAQSQLARITNDSSLLTRPQGLVLLNPISGGRSHPVAPPQPVLLEQSIKDLAEIRQSLQEEAEAFRHVVVSTANGLREAMAAREGLEEPPRLLQTQFFTVPARDPLRRTLTQQSASSTAHPTIADARLKSLIAEVRKKLTDGAPARVIQTVEGTVPEETDEQKEERKRIERERERIRVELEEKVKDLELEVSCVRAREEEAQRLIAEFARAQADAGSRAGSEGLEDEAEQMRREQRILDDEKRKFTEASMKLGEEKKKLEAERAAWLEERRQADVEAMLALLPTSPAAGEVSQPEEPKAPTSPRRNSWAQHRPSSPSPLSPHRARTPRQVPASAGKRWAKTPLSRLVLEKAVRQKGKETATALEMERLGANVLGDGSRKANATKNAQGSALRSSTIKSKAAGASKTPSLASSMARGNMLKSAANLRASQGSAPVEGLAKSQNAPPGREQLTKADGVGPRSAANKGRAWR